MSNPAVQLFCTNNHPMDRGADWCSTCGEPPAKPQGSSSHIDLDNTATPRSGEETK